MIDKFDSLGNELTNKQQDYFKNTKIVDKNNHLLVCYHGTQNPGFNEFDARKGSSQFGNYKFNTYNVNYFTTNKEVAIGYTDLGYEHDNNVYACYLNIVNPYIVDNKTKDEIARAWSNIKDENVRNKELAYFKKFYNKWKNKFINDDDLEELNDDIFFFNCEFRPNEDDIRYYDLFSLDNNTMFGKAHPLMFAYELNDYFDEYNFEEFRDSLIGDDEDSDDFSYTIDNLIKWVLLMNSEDNTNYDGIVVQDIHDVGPRGSMFSANTTDIITLKSSNQIKKIDNVNPTLSNKINEDKNLTFYIPQSLKDKIKNDEYYKDYEFKIVSLDKLVQDNNLNKKGDLDTYHTKEWGKDLDKFSINVDKIQDWNYSLPHAVLRDNRYLISDGKHRIKALQNDGYKYIELLVLEEQLSQNLLEATRNDLIVKSKKGDKYKSRPNENRYTRRTKSKIYKTVKDYNEIDMNKLFKKDELLVGIKVQGETDNYKVLIKLNGVIKEIADNVKRNNNILDFKAIIQALTRVFNNGDVYVHCSCPDFTYRFHYWATVNNYNVGTPQPSNGKEIANPYDTKGAACKHTLLVLSNADWLMKVASVINNYIHYAEENMESAFASIIFPKLYGQSYNKAYQAGLFDRNYLKHSKGIIDAINQYGRERTKFKNKKAVFNKKDLNKNSNNVKQLDLFDDEEE